jgi:hypothetical protein
VHGLVTNRRRRRTEAPSWAVCCASCARLDWPRRTSATIAAEDIPSSGRAQIPLLSHSARSVLYGGTQAENKPTYLL